jgi:hypothetical protein
MKEDMIAYRILIGNPEGRIHFGYLNGNRALLNIP